MKYVGLRQIAPQTGQTAQVYCHNIFKMLVCFDEEVIILQNIWRNIEQCELQVVDGGGNVK